MIEAERKCEEVGLLFEVALETLDAQSDVKPSHTNFGMLR